MSLSYADIKTAMDAAIKNAPSTKIRGGTHNTQLTNVAQHSRDRMADITINLSGLADNVEIYYDSSGGTSWKVRKSKHPFSFTNATKGDQIEHELDSVKVAVFLFDNNGVPFQDESMYTIDDEDKITFNITFTIAGTWTGTILRL